MSDPRQRFSRPSFGPSGTDGRSDPEDSTVLRRGLRDSGEPERPRGTAPSTYDAASRHATGPRATDESVWSRAPRPADPAPPAPVAGSHPSAASHYSAASQQSASGPPSAPTTSLPVAAPRLAGARSENADGRYGARSENADGRYGARSENADEPSARDELLARYHAREGGAARHRVRADGETLEVPLPGRRLSDARRGALKARALAVAALVLGLAGLALTGGFLAAMATRDRAGAGQVRSNGQPDWNTAAAESFGAHYLRTCLTRPRNDERAEQARIELLKAMNVGTFDEACRASTTTEPRPRTVGQIAFTGHVEPIDGMPKARFLGFTVDIGGTTTGYVVPIYLDDPVGGLGPGVAGRIGVSPSGGYGIPTGEGPTGGADNDLAASLRQEFLPQFLAAWAGSTASLEQFLAPDASESASAGLGGVIKDVQVTDVVARPRNKDVRPGQKPAYSDGDVVDLTVSATGTLAAGGQSQPSSYRVVLQRSNSKWFVSDAQGGVAEVPSGVPSPTRTPRPTKSPR